MEHSKGRADLDEPTPGDTSTLSFLADGADTREAVEGPEVDATGAGAAAGGSSSVLSSMRMISLGGWSD